LLLGPPPDGARRHAGRHRHRGNATISRGKCLRRRDQTTAPFIKKRRHCQKSLSNGLDIDHNHHIWYEKTVVNSIFTLSEVDSIISGRALRVQDRSRRHIDSPAGRLLVSASFGGMPPDALLASADFILLHGNDLRGPAEVRR